MNMNDLINFIKEKKMRITNIKIQEVPEEKSPEKPAEKEKTKKEPEKLCIQISKVDIPDYMKAQKELRGVCVGACICTAKWPKPRKMRDTKGNFIKGKGKDGKYVRDMPHCAHAHTNGPFKGYICFSSEAEFKKQTTCKHELAHIVTGQGHTKAWAEAYVGFGTPKWLTVEWLQKKYGFDDAGNEGMKVSDDWKKYNGIDQEKDVKPQEAEKKNEQG